MYDMQFLSCISVGGTLDPKMIMCILVKNTSLHILMSVVGIADGVKYCCHLSLLWISGCVFHVLFQDASNPELEFYVLTFGPGQSKTLEMNMSHDFRIPVQI